MSVVIISVDGCIGAGKTVFIDRIAPHLPWKVVKVREPVDKWKESGLLQAMYESIARKASDETNGNDGVVGMFQTYTFSTRIAELSQQYAEALRIATETGQHVILLTERSPRSDRAIFKHMLMQDGYINEVQSRIYEGCFEAWEKMFERSKPDVAIWLDTPPDECLRRQQTRGRKEEDAVFATEKARTYAEALHNRHVQVFSGESYEDVRVIKIDGATSFHTNDDVVAMMAAKLSNSILTAFRPLGGSAQAQD